VTDAAASPPAALAVDARAEIGVRNSQPEGIGRVAAVGSLVGWNNLGRNVVFADRSLRPVAVFGDTDFPDDDEASQYDLDVHAILAEPALGLVLVLNHLGTLRGFDAAALARGGRLRPVRPTVVGSFVADVERSAVVGGRLVGSGPRADGAIGLLVSEPLRPDLDGTLAVEPRAERFGEVTALAPLDSVGGDLLAVGGVGRVAVGPVTDRGVGPWRWERDVGFRVAVVADDGAVLWAAGPDAAAPVDDYDWDQLRGGAFVALDRRDGTRLAHGALPDGVAWGTGGVAVVALDGRLGVVGRDGTLHVVDPDGPGRDGSGCDDPVTAPLAPSSLGIAHAAVVGRRVLYGFNRGGYRLHSWTSPAPPPAPPRTA
jgi:hypothetical protein